MGWWQLCQCVRVRVFFSLWGPALCPVNWEILWFKASSEKHRRALRWRSKGRAVSKAPNISTMPQSCTVCTMPKCHYIPVQCVQCHYRNSALYKIVVTLWPAQPARSDALWIPIGFMSSLVWSKVAPLHLHILSSVQEGPPPTAQPTTDWWRGTRRSSVTTSTTRSGQPTLHRGLIRGWRWHKLIVLC